MDVVFPILVENCPLKDLPLLLYSVVSFGIFACAIRWKVAVLSDVQIKRTVNQ